MLPDFGVESNSNRTLRTESYDKMDPVGVDPRWDVFGPFHNYLLHAFPLVYVVPRIHIAFLFIGLQPLHPVFDHSQHVGFGLRVAWV